jgi:hypothetical protein
MAQRNLELVWRLDSPHDVSAAVDPAIPAPTRRQRKSRPDPEAVFKFYVRS